MHFGLAWAQMVVKGKRVRRKCWGDRLYIFHWATEEPGRVPEREEHIYMGSSEDPGQSPTVWSASSNELMADDWREWVPELDTPLPPSRPNATHPGAKAWADEQLTPTEQMVRDQANMFKVEGHPNDGGSIGNIRIWRNTYEDGHKEDWAVTYGDTDARHAAVRKALYMNLLTDPGTLPDFDPFFDWLGSVFCCVGRWSWAITKVLTKAVGFCAYGACIANSAIGIGSLLGSSWCSRVFHAMWGN